MEKINDDIKLFEHFQNLLISIATGGGDVNDEYATIRKYFINNLSYKQLLPSFVINCHEAAQFWSFIKNIFSKYEERRNFIWQEFSPLANHLENLDKSPIVQTIQDTLLLIDSDSVNAGWQKALERRNTDPDGAITSAKSLLESVLKHILDELQVVYSDSKDDLPKLYHLVAKEFNLSPSDYTEESFKQILGGCSSVVNGLSSIRNSLGDAHGKGKVRVKPAPRHATLAVNLAGSMAVFLIQTWESRNLSM